MAARWVKVQSRRRAAAHRAPALLASLAEISGVRATLRPARLGAGFGGAPMADVIAQPAPAVQVGARAAPDFAFAATAFASAALVFSVEPMVARLVLPLLGGSAAVWNTSLAFFQAALLVGYLYAHLLQRLASVRAQIVL